MVAIYDEWRQNPSHESIRSADNATRPPQATSLVDACNVGVDCDRLACGSAGAKYYMNRTGRQIGKAFCAMGGVDDQDT